MKCLKLFFVLFGFFALYGLGHSQDAPVSQLLLIPEILDNFDQSLNTIEGNVSASNAKTAELSLTVNSMQTTISLQQRQLAQESQNSRYWEQIASQRSQDSDATLQSLETSLTTSLQENREKDEKILKLTEANAKQMKVIFIMAGIIGLVIIYLIIRFILWIKSGAAASLIKKLF